MAVFNRRFMLQMIAITFVAASMTLGVAAQTTAGAATLADKIASASSKADHESIAAEFDKQADTDKAAAERHRKMAGAYTSAPWSKSGGTGMVGHCKALVKDYEKAAKQNAELAAMHRAIGAKLK